MHARKALYQLSYIPKQDMIFFYWYYSKQRNEKGWQKDERNEKRIRLKTLEFPSLEEEADFISEFKCTKGFHEVILSVSTTLLSE